MRSNRLSGWFSFVVCLSCFFLSCTDGKGFRVGGSRGGGSRFGGSKGSGTFGGSSGYNRPNNYGGGIRKTGSGSSFKSNAMSFGAGALGGVAAYSLMRSMSSSYHSRPGYYEPGYGTGATCVNNEDLNGTRFGQFRCPLNGFPLEAKYCCGESGKQFCCTPERTDRSSRSSFHFGWILLLVLIIIGAVFLWSRHRRNSNKDSVMVPMEPPQNEQQGPPFYHPQPPPMGYPPAPMGYPPNPQMNPYAPPPNITGNPYANPPQNHDGTFNPYPQQYQMPYPPPQQAHNPYQERENVPPNYDEAMHRNQHLASTKPI